jgi:hypothetical protein
MATTSPKKAARTEQQMFPLVESWLQSNLTQKEFSLKHQLSPHVLTYWISRYRQQGHPTPIPAPVSQEGTPSQASASFIRLDSLPANTTPAPTIPSAVIPEPTGMAIELPSGVVLRFPSLIPISYLQEVVSVCSR